VKDNNPSTANISKQRLRLWLQLLKTSRHIETQLRNNLRTEFNTTLPRFDVMSALERTPSGLKMSELSDQLMVSNGNVTGIIDRLEKDNLVERISVDGDRRATRVQLSTTGKQEFSAMASAHEIWVDELMQAMDTDSIERTEEVLNTLRDPHHD
jgi:DNA-binding MarR family transcriptional regulator